ncbi:hypothetical protein [Intrasporangium sp. YIM S08009]|uniref:hypothetical protein n=1 Tax=Intrasporangium zincisolvens TaxID=3080018 RepID=UPI002B062145|nr:hypothetical protein [Intrasporangium sp. YIM S08009]
MSPVPRALSRARLWTSGLLTASTLLVGGIGVHLAQDHAASVATTSSTTTTTSSGASGSTRSSGTDDSSNGTDTSSSDTSSSSSSGTSNQSSGFQAVVPLSGSGGQAQSGSGGS